VSIVIRIVGRGLVLGKQHDSPFFVDGMLRCRLATVRGRPAILIDAEAPQDRAHGVRIGDDGEDLALGSVVRTRERIDGAHSLQQSRPGIAALVR